MRTYDIINAGPNNRFMAGGKIVSNSGWGYNPQNLPRVSGKPSDCLRKSLRAPPGYKVVVADLSGIELRVNHFLWQVPSSMALFQADPEKADLYKEFASALYQVDRAAVTKDQRQVGKVAHLGLGFGAGGATFQKVAKLMAGIQLSVEEAADVVAKWRAAYPEIVAGWKTCHAALPKIYLTDTNTETYSPNDSIDPWGMCYATKGGIKTPKGFIAYPDLRQETNDDGKTEWVYGTGRNKARIYAGKVTENCIAEGTLVLTQNGWVPIELITDHDLVHDGDNFVRHGGKVLKSVQSCVNVDGVYMTADHEVLTNEGWKPALEKPEPYRPNIRCADRSTTVTLGRSKDVVDVQVRVREDLCKSRFGGHKRNKTRGNAKLWMFNTYPTETPENAWNDEAPSVRRMARDDRSLPTSIAQGVEKLRSAWNNRVRPLAALLRELLGRYGRFVPEGAGFRSSGQQCGVFPGELPMGSASSKYDEQTQHSSRGCTNAIQRKRNPKVNPVLPVEEKPTTFRVYDILNSGPQHRFVVLGKNGPFIVHNCVQHLARCIIADNALAIRKTTGLSPVLMVHDEIVYVAPESEAEDVLRVVQGIMRTPPTWWPELVTWSEGDIADTYGEAK